MAEIMLIMIVFYDSGYRCLKHFYVEMVCRLYRILLRKQAIVEIVNDEMKNIVQAENYFSLLSDWDFLFNI